MRQVSTFVFYSKNIGSAFGFKRMIFRLICVMILSLKIGASSFQRARILLGWSPENNNTPQKKGTKTNSVGKQLSFRQVFFLKCFFFF
jgi:hypothetical protein